MDGKTNAYNGKESLRFADSYEHLISVSTVRIRYAPFPGRRYIQYPRQDHLVCETSPPFSLDADFFCGLNLNLNLNQSQNSLGNV